MNLSKISNIPVLLELFTLSLLAVPCLRRFKDLTMPKLVNKSSKPPLLSFMYSNMIIAIGIPKSEFMARGSEIKVLNSKEIEGVREACRVCQSLAIFLETSAKSNSTLYRSLVRCLKSLLRLSALVSPQMKLVRIFNSCIIIH